MNKQKFIEIWQSNSVQFTLDVCRIVMLIIAVLIFYKLITEIDAVKMLNYDPCKLCESKTGSQCFYLDELAVVRKMYSEVNNASAMKYSINTSELDKLLSNG